jgi:ribosomal protein L29
MKTKELREQDINKLRSTLADISRDYAEKRTLFRVKRAKDTSFFKKLRRDMAQLNTIIKEKEILR